MGAQNPSDYNPSPEFSHPDLALNYPFTNGSCMRRDRKHNGRFPGTTVVPQSHSLSTLIYQLSVQFFHVVWFHSHDDQLASSRPQIFEETVLENFRQWLRIEYSSFCTARRSYYHLLSVSVQGIKTNTPVNLIGPVVSR